MRWGMGRGAKKDAEVDRELGFHLDALTREYEATGTPYEEARRRAHVAFGGREQVKQQVREVHLSIVFEALRSNTQAALRFLRRAPGLAFAVIVTLALGIGANTAVFSAIDAIILRPLPFPQGDQLMSIRQYDTKGKEPWTFTAPARLEDWNRQNSTFMAISGYYTQDESEISGPMPERLENAIVAPHLFEVLGIAPQLGRGFTPAEEHWGGPEAVLISDRLWRRRFHSDPDVLGKQLHFGKSSSAIVGVMPASFAYPDRDADLWSPNAPDAPYAQDRNSTWFKVVGRVRPGVPVPQAQADLATVQQRLGLQFPKSDGNLGVRIEPLKAIVVGGVGNSLWLLYGAVTLLLLIACINIAALLLARTSDREREIALRFALGASRRTVIAQLLSEVLLLALLGSLLGLALADGAVHLFHHLAVSLPRGEEVALDWRLLCYTFTCAVMATLLCGLYPALRGTRRELAHTLALGSRTQVSERGGLQWWLVGAQVALAVTLLVGAGLLLRSFQALGRVSPGFEPARVLTLQISGGWGETVDMKRLTQRIDTTLDALRTVPGVEAAATSASLPGVAGPIQTEFLLAEGAKDDRHKLLATTRFVSSGYFATTGIPVLAGEACGASEVAGRLSSRVVVNRSFATHFLPRETGLRLHLRNAVENPFMATAEIRGIVGDAREDGLNTLPAPTVYWCTSAPTPSPYFLVRTTGQPMAMAEPLRRKLHAIEPGRSVFGISPLQDHLDDSFAENRLRTGVLTFFAATAISLACLGLYGTLTYLGRTRQREMGLRLAMGASRAQVAGSLLGRGLRSVVVGCAAGLLMAVAASRLLAGMLYGVTPTDPGTYAAIASLVLLVACAACAGPALRAARTDPASALRDE